MAGYQVESVYPTSLVLELAGGKEGHTLAKLAEAGLKFRFHGVQQLIQLRVTGHCCTIHTIFLFFSPFSGVEMLSKGARLPYHRKKLRRTWALHGTSQDRSIQLLFSLTASILSSY